MKDVRVQHPWRLVSAIGGVVLLAIVGYAGWLLWSAASGLGSAADDASEMKAAALDGDSDRVSRALDDFQRHADAASDATGSPVWSGLTKLPWFGDDARGVRTLSRVADDLSRHGLAQLTDAVGDIDAVLPRDGGIDVARVQRLTAPVAEGRQALVSARNALALENPSGYVESLKLRYRDLQSKVEDAADAMGVADRALRVMPQMLGADGKRNYLLIMQNNAEIRATGGLPGAVSLLSADSGKLTMVRQVAGGAFGEAPAPVLPLQPAEVKLYGQNLGRYFLDANLTPDFPRSAALWRARWEQTQPEKVDGVISLDTVTLSYLLGAIGPVDAGGVHLTADNAVEELLSKVYARLPEPADQDAFFRDVAASVFTKVTSFSGSKQDLLQALGRAADERRILVHDFHGDVQRTITGTAVAGEVTADTPETPQIGVYFGDGTLSKMSYYLRYNASVQATSCVNGVQTFSGKLTLRSTAPKDAKTSLPPYVTGIGLPKASAGTQLVTIYIYAPVGGDAGKFDANGLDFDQFSAELDGRKVIGTWLLVDPGQVRDLTWTMKSGPAQTRSAQLSVTPSVVPGDAVSALRSAC